MNQKLLFEKNEINIKEMQCRNTISPVHKKPINQIVLLNENKQFAVGSEDFNIQIYDSESLELIKTLEGHSQKIFCMIAMDNCYLVSGSQDKKIIIWNIFTGNKEIILTGSENHV
eukprot:TRINITY_DN1775_c0_g1_i3.p6 TRINITY_DN1775_c0_g1~~TRINITY_DN1775_c0_g1_i3.p6  ORF type:complete len:115 (+),score=21.77 TRINITY_DN1775_c0_g1_i3:832-1176(+)